MAAACLFQAAAATPNDCRPCHAAITERFLQTGMGRSIALRPAPPEGELYHRLSNRTYTLRDGRIRRHQTGANGAPVQIVDLSVDVAIGSGNHAITFAHRTPSGALIELPVSWYARRGGYAMSPGYDRADHPGMRREIADACLFCHAAYPKQAMSGGLPPEPIGCERCHGDATAHLRDARRGTILNPAGLPAARQLDICLQCHLQTASRGITDALLRPGRKTYSFRPGEPLADYKTVFDRADDPAPRLEVNHAGYRLLQSACFRGAKGQMTCTTCHDPHTAQARNACIGCHTPSHPGSDSGTCAGCHMPKRTPSDAIHVTITDHWIARRPAAWPAPEREDHTPYTGRVNAFYTPSDPLTLVIANGGPPSADLATLYRQHLARDPNDVATLAALGNTLFRLGQREEATSMLRRALKVEATHAGALNTLAVLLASGGAEAEALTLLQRAVRAHPQHSLSWYNLGITRQAMGNRQRAAAALREAIRLQPDFAEARARLAALAP